MHQRKQHWAIEGLTSTSTITVHETAKQPMPIFSSELIILQRQPLAVITKLKLEDELSVIACTIGQLAIELAVEV